MRNDQVREPDPKAIATPPILMAFALLHQDGRELTVECSPKFCSGGELKLTARTGRLKPRFSGVPR